MSSLFVDEKPCDIVENIEKISEKNVYFFQIVKKKEK